MTGERVIENDRPATQQAFVGRASLRHDHEPVRRFGKISVVGLGYIGLPTAAMFASRKIRVVGVDLDAAIVDKVNAGEIHIVEPDLDIVTRAVVAGGYLSASTVVEHADAFLIAVPTPLKEASHAPDLSHVEAAALAIAPVLIPGNLVVLESTCPVGTTEALACWLAAARPDLTFPQTHGPSSDIRIAHCPERVLPGQVMRELVENDRVIGGMTACCAQAAVALYRTFVQGQCIVTDARTAEMAKLTENSFRDVNIAFANELSVICEAQKIDVWELIRLANRHPRVEILRPGPGVGGHCIAVDPWLIISKTPELARLMRAARAVNDAKPDWVIERIQATIGGWLMAHPALSARDVTVACYGLSFKPDIDDLRESPAARIAKDLSELHAGTVLAVEPNIARLPDELAGLTLVDMAHADAVADIKVFLVGHSAFRAREKPSGAVVDVTGIWSRFCSP